MTSRLPLRGAAQTAAAIAGTCALAVLTATPALARVQDDGAETADGLSLLETLFWFVGIPLALFLGITLLVVAPGLVRGPRYRPGVGWWAAPVWFDGPDDADTAVRDAVALTGGGGASARW